jgi:hypothetical protein
MAMAGRGGMKPGGASMAGKDGMKPVGASMAGKDGMKPVGMAKGGGIETKGKTKGTMVKMAHGGKTC